VSNLQFILIGHGHIGQRHAAIINAMPGCELAAIIEPSLVCRSLGEGGNEKREARNETEGIRDQNPETRGIRDQNPETGGIRDQNPETRGIRDQNPETRGIRDQNPETRDQKIQLRSETAWFETIEEFLIHNSKFIIQNSVAVLATPNNLHCAQAIQCLEAGMHVVIEKPMGLRAEECKRVIEVAKRANRKVFCVMQNRYSPPAKWLKEMVGSNRLGKIYQVQVNCFWNRGAAYYAESDWKGKLAQDGGTLFTQFSHFVDTLFWLFGSLEPISAQFYNHNHKYLEFEDSGVVTARGENPETRDQSPDLRSETLSSKTHNPNAQNPNLITQNLTPITQTPIPNAQNPNLITQNLTPKTQNPTPKPQNLTPKTQTPQPKTNP